MYLSCGKWRIKLYYYYFLCFLSFFTRGPYSCLRELSGQCCLWSGHSIAEHCFRASPSQCWTLTMLTGVTSMTSLTLTSITAQRPVTMTMDPPTMADPQIMMDRQKKTCQRVEEMRRVIRRKRRMTARETVMMMTGIVAFIRAII